MANPSDLFRPDERQPRLPVDALARGRPDTAVLIHATWLSRVWNPAVAKQHCERPRVFRSTAATIDHREVEGRVMSRVSRPAEHIGRNDVSFLAARSDRKREDVSREPARHP